AGTPERGELRVGLLEWSRRKLWQVDCATRAADRACPVPGAAIRTEHRSAPELEADEVIRRPRPALVDLELRKAALLFVHRLDEGAPLVALDQERRLG